MKIKRTPSILISHDELDYEFLRNIDWVNAFNRNK